MAGSDPLVDRPRGRRGGAATSETSLGDLGPGNGAHEPI